MLRVRLSGSDQEIAVAAQPHDTILSIKKRIEVQESIPATHCRLVFTTKLGAVDKLGCRELSDGELVQDVKLRDTVQLFADNEPEQRKLLEKLLGFVHAMEKLQEEQKEQEEEAKREERQRQEEKQKMHDVLEKTKVVEDAWRQQLELDAIEDEKRQQTDCELFKREQMLIQVQEDGVLAQAEQEVETLAERVRVTEEEFKISADASEALRQTQEALAQLQREEEQQMKVRAAAEAERRRQEEERRRREEEELRRREEEARRWRDPNMYFYPPASWYESGDDVKHMSVKISLASHWVFSELQPDTGLRHSPAKQLLNSPKHVVYSPQQQPIPLGVGHHNAEFDLGLMRDGTLRDMYNQKVSRVFYNMMDVDGSTEQLLSSFQALPANTFCVHNRDCESFLSRVLRRVGIGGTEALDFIAYCRPIFSKSQYTNVTFLSTLILNSLISINIEPKPARVQRIFAVLQNVNQWDRSASQSLRRLKPAPFFTNVHSKAAPLPLMSAKGNSVNFLVVPEREEFVVVEWGAADVSKWEPAAAAARQAQQAAERARAMSEFAKKLTNEINRSKAKQQELRLKREQLTRQQHVAANAHEHLSNTRARNAAERDALRRQGLIHQASECY